MRWGSDGGAGGGTGVHAWPSFYMQVGDAGDSLQTYLEFNMI